MDSVTGNELGDDKLVNSSKPSPPDITNTFDADAAAAADAEVEDDAATAAACEKVLFDVNGGDIC